MTARHVIAPRRFLLARRISSTHELMVRVAWPVRLDRWTNGGSRVPDVVTKGNRHG